MLKRKSIKILISALLLALVLVGLPNLSPVHRVAAVNRTIVLVGFLNAWNFSTTANPTITVTQGDSVSLQLSSGDAIVHRWFVDVDKNGDVPDCPGADICSNPFSTSTVLTFTVSFAPGGYTYYCSVHPATMLGSFVVNPSTSVGGTAVPVDRLALVAPYLGLALLIIAATTVTVVHLGRSKRGEEEP